MDSVQACKTKLRFVSKKAARHEAAKRGWANRTSYHCQHCNGYHLSKRSGRTTTDLYKLIDKANGK